MSDLQQRLLEAHVQHELARFSGSALSEQFETWVRDLFRWLRDVRLDEVSSSQQVLGIIDRYVIELRISGGIVELLGEMSQLVFDSRTGEATPLEALLGDDLYEKFAEKVAALDGVRRQLIGLVAHSEAAELAHARLLSHALGDLMLGAARHSPLLKRALLGLEARVARVLTRQLELRRERMGALREAHLLDVFDQELVRSVADEVWTAVAAMPLRKLFAAIDKQDLEDFVVLGHEFWLRYRKSPYFQQIAREMVEHFFRKYGQTNLQALIDDMGVSEQMVVRELEGLLTPVLTQAARTGFLEQQIRERLEPFYASPACQELLKRS